MKKVFSKVVHVVSAIKGDQSEFWAAATPRGVAAGQVQQATTPWMDGDLKRLAAQSQKGRKN